MGLLDKLTNKIQFIASKQLNDPEADEFARQKSIQDKQDEEVRLREEQQLKDEEDEEIQNEEDKKAAEELQRRSEFKPYRAVGNAASLILKIFGSIILVSVMLYSGHLAANQAIGYRTPFRVLYFIYGFLLFFLVIPKTLYESLVLKKAQKYYTFFPLSTYTPNGQLENVFLTPFCYVEDEFSKNARKIVEDLYAKAYTVSNSVKAVATVGALAATAVKAVNSPKVNSNNDPKKPEVNTEAKSTNEPSKNPEANKPVEPAKAEPAKDAKAEPAKAEAAKTDKPAEPAKV
jgi:hypothetical protein